MRSTWEIRLPCVLPATCHLEGTLPYLESGMEATAVHLPPLPPCTTGWNLFRPHLECLPPHRLLGGIPGLMRWAQLPVLPACSGPTCLPACLGLLGAGGITCRGTLHRWSAGAWVGTCRATCLHDFLLYLPLPCLGGGGWRCTCRLPLPALFDAFYTIHYHSTILRATIQAGGCSPWEAHRCSPMTEAVLEAYCICSPCLMGGLAMGFYCLPPPGAAFHTCLPGGRWSTVEVTCRYHHHLPPLPWVRDYLVHLPFCNSAVTDYPRLPPPPAVHLLPPFYHSPRYTPAYHQVFALIPCRYRSACHLPPPPPGGALLGDTGGLDRYYRFCILLRCDTTTCLQCRPAPCSAMESLPCWYLPPFSELPPFWVHSTVPPTCRPYHLCHLPFLCICHLPMRYRYHHRSDGPAGVLPPLRPACLPGGVSAWNTASYGRPPGTCLGGVSTCCRNLRYHRSTYRLPACLVSWVGGPLFALPF